MFMHLIFISEENNTIINIASFDVISQFFYEFLLFLRTIIT
jgi:hypothetical protein